MTFKSAENVDDAMMKDFNLKLEKQEADIKLTEARTEFWQSFSDFLETAARCLEKQTDKSTHAV